MRIQLSKQRCEMQEESTMRRTVPTMVFLQQHPQRLFLSVPSPPLYMQVVQQELLCMRRRQSCCKTMTERCEVRSTRFDHGRMEREPHLLSVEIRVCRGDFSCTYYTLFSNEFIPQEEHMCGCHALIMLLAHYRSAAAWEEVHIELRQGQ